MGKKKKGGKNRLDKYYYLAKDQGYRSRAAFKLIQLNKKFNFLGKATALLDLCAAPGSWLQVAAKFMPVSRVIIGVDLDPIKPIPNVVTLKQDITTPKCRSEISSHLKGTKADVVLHDGAPNVGTAWIQDAYSQSELTLHALKLAVEFLSPGGTFVTKIFRSADYNTLLWVFHQLFKKVTATKPTASRSTSAEIFVVCQEYLNPKKIDPKLLDPRAVFKDLEVTKSIVNPFSKKKKERRNREGYETDSMLLFKKCSVLKFINAEEPVRILAEYNELSFEVFEEEGDKEQIELILQHPKTTTEIRCCLKDLKVLNAKDFKLLLKWRLAIRKFAQMEKEEEEENEPAMELTEEQKSDLLQQEMDDKLRRQAKRRKKKEREREKKIQKFSMRQGLQSNIEDEFEAPTDIGLFNLRQVRRQATLEKLVGKRALEEASNKITKVKQEDALRMDVEAKIAEEEENLEKIKEKLVPEEEEDDDVDPEEKYDKRTEQYLDMVYQQYLTANEEFRKKLSHKSKIERKKLEIPEDLSNFEKFEKMKELEEEQIEIFDDEPDNELLINNEKEAITQRAALWFDSDLFNDIEAENDDEEAINKLLQKRQEQIKKRKRAELLANNDTTTPKSKKQKLDKNVSVVGPSPVNDNLSSVSNGEKEEEEEEKEKEKSGGGGGDGAYDDGDEEFDKIEASSEIYPKEDEDDVGFEEVPGLSLEDLENDVDQYTEEERAEMLALGKKLQDPLQRNEVVDRSINRYMYDDNIKNVPQWFVDDESEHNKPQIPVTKEQVRQYKEELKAINSRTIKKVAEAKARKKKKYTIKLEKARSKAKSIVSSTDLSEKEKIKQIQKLYKGQLSKVKPQKVYVVGKKRLVTSKIPKGKNVRMKLVDARLKKDKRSKAVIDKKNKSSSSKKRRSK